MTGTDVSTAKAKKARSPPAHPPFVEMITAAIVSLKERTGSSQYAITKFVEDKHKNLPPTFKKLLLNHLKKLVAAGKLVKVKNSFKLPPVRSVAPAKEKAAASAPKSKTAAKPKAKVAAKPKAKAVASKPKPATAKPKLKAIAALAKPAAKAARTSTRTSPGKKADVKPKAKAKKPVAPARAVRKPKSVKSPVKRKAPARKAKK